MASLPGPGNRRLHPLCPVCPPRSFLTAAVTKPREAQTHHGLVGHFPAVAGTGDRVLQASLHEADFCT